MRLIKTVCLIAALAMPGCAISHDDYLAYKKASLWAAAIAGMECYSLALSGNKAPNCQEVRHWASMHVAGY